MRVTIIGGGPGGLFSAILLRKAFPQAHIHVHEQNGPHDAFGFGVVFSDETLGHIAAADPESFREIEACFIQWKRIETWHKDQWIVSEGHGFCGLERHAMLAILQRRAAALGVELSFHDTVSSAREAAKDCDLLIACDGVNSRVREELRDVFQPTVEARPCRFSWLAGDFELPAFTFIFAPTVHGLFTVHAYPFKRGRSTWIVECAEDTWRKAGFEGAADERTVELCETLFAPWLKGRRLLASRSVWRQFPQISNAHWHDGDHTVLLGDAVHTAHFSIGSGTKLAMEDAIALRDAMVEAHNAGSGIPQALANYEAARRGPVERLQRSAITSMEWFENATRYTSQSPEVFNFNLMTRSRRIGYDNLSSRDPQLVRHAVERWAQDVGAAPDSAGNAVPPAYTPFQLRGVTLNNRVVVSPMCQYSAVDGVPGDWHLVHLGSRAVGGAGLVIAEMTNVAAEGRISKGCCGLWNTTQREAWKRITSFVREHSSARMGMQLAHAGRKGSAELPWVAPEQQCRDGWATLAPSPIPWAAHWNAPREMSRADMENIRDAFVRSAELAVEAGFDLVELHMAHGYLLSSFITPLSNQRKDAYGGSLAGRMRFPLEVFDAVRASLPREMPVSVRISAHDWHSDPASIKTEDAVQIARLLKEHGCDIVDVSSGGTSPQGRPQYGRMYQVPFAETVRHEAGIPVIAVGGIESIDQVNTLVLAGRADLCAIARAHLADPYLTQRGAAGARFPDHPWPRQYIAARPRLP
ncbi:MAG: bifunctional salicylyl-CoA 5-hydroxylase/oxidoreductase [Planctomycetes bacterium]|nr:bifunctional salicylyl-CoA 5-hydroxylase/oxidoreductase [Planctomycetota bacterium]